MHYYNENEPKAAAWLKQLIIDGHLPHGDVDDRSIEDVKPSDLSGYTQCHFFAGIGGWPLVLQLAGWPTDRPVWTGSCPCQPFSAAGARGGVDDPRHLWPVWRWLIDQCRPPVVFGEQVASKAGREWLTGVQTDLQAMGFDTAGADLCAAGVGAPHIRQRLWFVAHSPKHRAEVHGEFRGSSNPQSVGMECEQQRLSVEEYTAGEDPHAQVNSRCAEGADCRSHQQEQTGQQTRESTDSFALGEQPQQRDRYRCSETEGAQQVDSPDIPERYIRVAGGVHDEGGSTRGSGGGREEGRPEPSSNSRLGHALSEGSQRHAGDGDHGAEPGRHDTAAAGSVTQAGGDSGMADSGRRRSKMALQQCRDSVQADESRQQAIFPGGSSPHGGGWAGAGLIPCADGKARRIEPGIKPLVDGVPRGMVPECDPGAPGYAENTGEARVMRLYGYGNAIVPQVGAEFVGAFMAEQWGR